MSSRGKVACALNGCGHPPIAAVHNRKLSTYRHDFTSRDSMARRTSRAKAPILCERCDAGRHDGRKTEIGCVEIVAPEPRDYVCQCVHPLCREALPRTMKRRSDTQGVIQMQWGSGL